MKPCVISQIKSREVECTQTLFVLKFSIDPQFKGSIQERLKKNNDKKNNKISKANKAKIVVRNEELICKTLREYKIK